jgi:hypothetical protein
MPTTQADDSFVALADRIGRSMAKEIVRELRTGNVPVTPEYLNPKEAAALTGFTPKALERYRQQPDKGPRFYKVDSSIRYRAEDLRSWIEAGGPAQ